MSKYYKNEYLFMLILCHPTYFQVEWNTSMSSISFYTRKRIYFAGQILTQQTRNTLVLRELMSITSYTETKPLGFHETLTPYTTKNGTSQRRVRTIFTKLQLMALETLFQQQHYLSPHKRRETAFLLNLNETQGKFYYRFSKIHAGLKHSKYIKLK